MYTPEISAAIACGENIPPLTQWERQDHLNFSNLIDTMKCLYTRDFKPLFSEQDCSCIKCYDPGMWSMIIQHASRLNKKLIWNDIIKRWEPKEFDQDFSEDSDTNSQYEFRTYKSIYGIDVDSYNNACDNCSPFSESRRGIGFIKAFYSYDTSDTTEGCCACNLLNPSMVIQRYSGGQWRTVSDNASVSSYVFEKSDSNTYRILFRTADSLINDFIPCGNHVWKAYQTDYVEENGNYVLVDPLPTVGTTSGDIIIKFIDVLDNTQTFECRYEWSFRIQ